MSETATATATATPLLEVEDAQVRYRLPSGLAGLVGGDKKYIDAVAGVSLSVARGETLAIVGESGSGKTTLIRAIEGLADLASGEVRLEGSVVSGASSGVREVRRRVSMIFQDPVGSLSPRMRVSSIVTEPLRIRGGHSRRALGEESVRLLEMVGLGADFGERYPHELSGGQARRVGVARALSTEPDLLLADEPTAGLDVSVQGEVLNLLNELRERLGLSIVMITHNLNIIRHVADRVMVMYLGRIVESGDAASVLSSPRHPYTRILLSANPTLDAGEREGRVVAEGETPGLLERPTGCEFHPRCPYRRDDCSSRAPELAGDSARLHRCLYPLN
ncbi:MAG: ABC transporter ATP-binding protein [Alphaproteobacteria bacterium]|nr:ABC transporter ATP-binding protein [Alphaproteobacteria bacterium]MDA8003768.1 ABC transporter ATP-binding protein [Alphaproteobacteria bacterium]MDA8005666.1 ABC transporter ATP-binding protein [Alphaproteobacteria bacterium]MDA8013380.1 ABC transporter ATP-binding protein [Alphaproteobacteria bacterium]